MTLLSRKAAAAHLGIGHTLFHTQVRPTLRAVKIGGRVLFRTEDLDAWAARQAEAETVDIAPLTPEPPAPKRAPEPPRPVPRVHAPRPERGAWYVDPVSRRLRRHK